MARKTDASVSAEQVVDTNERTTRSAVMNVVKGTKLIAHVEIPAVKGPKSFTGLWESLGAIWSDKWGNGKLPAPTKLPTQIKVDETTSLYVQLVADTTAQCSTCGVFKSEPKTAWCPECQGVVKNDALEIDI